MNPDSKDFLLHEYDAARQNLIALEEKRYLTLRFLLIIAAALVAAGGTVVTQINDYLWAYGACCLVAAYFCRLLTKMLQNEERAISRYRNMLNWIRKYFLDGDSSLTQHLTELEKFGARTDVYKPRTPRGVADFFSFFFGGASRTFSTSRVILISCQSITWLFLALGLATMTAAVILAL